MSDNNNVKTLLVVDDSRVSRMMIRAFVLAKQPHWAIIEAASGNEAVELVAHNPPDFCTMDINMPGLNGIDAAALILEKQPKVRVVILTANIQGVNQNRATELGARFVSKPVTEKAIAQALEFFESVA
ncbi:Response regulator receiver protein [Gammaproteobacteria bacterium]